MPTNLAVFAANAETFHDAISAMSASMQAASRPRISWFERRVAAETVAIVVLRVLDRFDLELIRRFSAWTGGFALATSDAARATPQSALFFHGHLLEDGRASHRDEPELTPVESTTRFDNWLWRLCRARPHHLEPEPATVVHEFAPRGPNRPPVELDDAAFTIACMSVEPDAFREALRARPGPPGVRWLVTLTPTAQLPIVSIKGPVALDGGWLESLAARLDCYGAAVHLTTEPAGFRWAFFDPARGPATGQGVGADEFLDLWARFTVVVGESPALIRWPISVAGAPVSSPDAATGGLRVPRSCDE